jgi:23S rRNA (uracil747-C5)-methyltransferase
VNCNAFDSKRCNSCGLLSFTYEQGLNNKIEIVKNMFANVNFLDPVKSKIISGYRNKAKFIIGGDLLNPIIGIPSPKNIKIVSPLVDCPLHIKIINDLAIFILKSISEFNLIPYDINTKKGEFKYLIITQGHLTNEISIRFGMRSLESFERVEKLYSKASKIFPNIKVMSFEVQPKHAATFSGTEHYLSLDKYIHHDFGDIQLASSTSNFFQVNSLVALNLYKRIYDRFKDKGLNIALDLFCGVGGFAISLGKISNLVFGIELNQVAIDCANYSLEKNNLSNVTFICDDANNFETHIKDKIDLVVVNPPRRGIGEKLCKLLLKMSSKYIVYSSCNATSLNDDIKILNSDYEIESMTPVDMFPLTNHLELLCIMVKRSNL